MKCVKFHYLRKAASIFSCCVLFGILCEIIYLKHESCDESDSVRQIQLLCSQFHNKEIVGSMCSSLCDNSTYRLNRCHGNKEGKKVMIMECDGCIEPGKTSDLVLKAEYDMTEWRRSLGANITESKTLRGKVAMVIKDIILHTREYYDTDLSEHDDIISFILGENYNEIINQLNIADASDVVLRTAMVLGSQEEFLSFRILGSRSFLPKLYGTCGPAYFVENTPSFSSLNYIYFTAKKPDILSMKLHSPSWQERAKAAVSVLNMVPEIEDKYASALQICDVQPHNFGISESGETVMLDSDSLKFGQVVYNIACETDSDCKFITCLGKCNQTRKWCEKEMVTNNLQVICRRLFVTDHAMFGLLRGAPSSVQERLTEVLKRCMDPEEKIFKLPRENKSDRQILLELKSLLTSSL